MVSDKLTKVPELFVNFPAQLNDGLDKTRLIFSSDRVTWYRPTSLDDLLTLKSTYPEAELVIGNTKAGMQIPLLSLHDYQSMSFKLYIFAFWNLASVPLVFAVVGYAI